MKVIIISLLLYCLGCAQNYVYYYRDHRIGLAVDPGSPATQGDYYVDAVSGNDANSGTHPDTAWQTLNKVSGESFVPGDTILFNRGDTFSGTLTISSSGSSDVPIVYGAYGTGTNPIITARTIFPLTSWVNVNGDLTVEGNAVRDTVWKIESVGATINNFRFWGQIDGTWEELIMGNSNSSTDGDGILAYDNKDTTYFVNYAHKFSYDYNNDILYIYTDGNSPTTYYDAIEYSGQYNVADPVDNANVLSVQGDYVEFHNMNFEGGGVSTVYLNNVNVVGFYDCEIGKYARWYGVLPRGGGANDSVTFKRCIFDADFAPPYKRYYMSGGTYQYVTTGIYSGSDDGSHGRNWIIDSCTIKNWHIGIVLAGGTTTGLATDTVNIRYNHFISSDVDYSKPLQLNGARHVNIYSNLIDTCNTPLQINPNRDYPDDDYYCSSVFIGFNTWRTALQNFTPHDDQGADFINIQGFGTSGSDRTLYIFNNTFLNGYQNPIANRSWNPKEILYNNVFVNSNNTGVDYQYYEDGSLNNLYWENNYFSKSGYDSTSTDIAYFLNDASYFTLQELHNLSGSDGNIIMDNKMDASPASLINTTTGRIVGSSPAINTGRSVSAIITLMGITGDFYDYWETAVTQATPNRGSDDEKTP